MSCWNADQLSAELKRYEAACVEAGCAAATLNSYIRYGMLFLDWRIGLSHTPGAPGPRHSHAHCASPEELKRFTAEVTNRITETK